MTFIMNLKIFFSKGLKNMSWLENITLIKKCWKTKFM